MGDVADVVADRRTRLNRLRQRYHALNLRSRSVRLFRTTMSGALDLHPLQTLRPKAFRLFLERLGTESRDPIPIVRIQPPDQDALAFANTLGMIARKARETEMETGAHELAVGWPFLEGRCDDGTWVRGPLFLYPVTISTTLVGRVRWTVTFEGLPDCNETLLQVVGSNMDQRVGLQDFLDADEDGLFKIDEETWRSFSRLLRDKGLNLTNEDDHLPDLEPIPPRPRDVRDAAPKGRFSLRNHLVLGRFPKWGSTVVRDYEALLSGDLSDEALGIAADLLAVDEDAEWEDAAWDDAAREDGDGVGLGGGGARLGKGSGAQSPEPPEHGFWEDATSASSADVDALTQFRQWQILPSDASQDAVFSFLDRSTGLVVQGPPGTGKSQLIANLVAAAIGAGKTVLVACQKRAALDVVAERLEAQGLREPVAVVHDVERDRNRVCGEIDATLSRVLARNADEVPFEQTLAAARVGHEQALRRLQSRLKLAHEAFATLTQRDRGRPPLAVLQERALKDDGRPLPNLSDVAAEVSETELEEVLPRIEAVCEASQRFSVPHPLAVRRRWHDVSQEAIDEAFETLDRMVVLARELEALPSTMTPEEAAEKASLWNEVSPLLDLLEQGDDTDQSRFRYFWVWTGGDLRHGEWQRVMEVLSAAQVQLARVPSDLVAAPRDQVENDADGLARLSHLDTRWYKAFVPEWWRLRKLPQKVVDAYGITGEENQEPARLESLCREALKWMDLIAALPIDMPFMDVGLQGDPADVTRLVERLERWHRLVEAVHLLSGALSAVGGPYADWPDVKDVGKPLASAPMFEAALRDRRRAELYLQFREALRAVAPLFAAGFMRDLETWAAKGVWEKLIRRLETLQQARDDAAGAASVDRLMADLPDWAWTFLNRWRSRHAGTRDGVVSDARTAVERAWRTALLGDRHPHVLEAPLVDPHHLERLSKELEAMRSVAAKGVLARYHQRLGRSVEVTGRERSLRKLEAEVRKRRRRMTLRRLVERFWDTGLKQVRPAWFCSPESIAALFPLTPGLFDLVIFDEASQCPVESGIPALVRARRAVIAGDDQQMPPSHFFRASLEDDPDDEEASVLASQSILALARIAQPATTLRWHYRSRHEELVAFSNAAFYGGRLITAPHARGVERFFEGLHWVRVDGYWKEQMNPVEADRVVSVVRELLVTSDGGAPPTVGVVTFNRKQAALIQRLIDLRADKDPAFLEALGKDRSRPVVEQLFVRNLENVQGDERDVIVFSPGYGPSESGGKVHARFGPLGQAGGEKRLNVAVTRARLGVWVVASFDPDAIDVAGSKHPGPKLFRLYLEYVRKMAAGQGASDSLLEEAAALGQGRGVTAGVPVQWDDHGGPGNVVATQLATVLRRKGYRVRENVGLGGLKLDLAVGRPESDRWCLGIDCRRFLHIPDDLDRDVYTPGFWRRMGWRVDRVSPAIWLDRRDQVIAAVASACASSDNSDVGQAFQPAERTRG